MADSCVGGCHIEEMREEIDTLESLLIEALPYLECAKSDPIYKPDRVARLTRKVRAELQRRIAE